jgi:1,4-dihydroxy-2-naphthoyl-CoA hydrolase
MASSTVKVRFFDCDPAGIMFYARLFDLCHAAYEELIDGMSLSEDFWSNATYAVPITRTEARYLKPIRYGSEIVVSLEIRALTESSYDVHYTCRSSEGVTCAKAQTSHVVVDKTTFQRRPMPAELAVALAACAEQTR